MKRSHTVLEVHLDTATTEHGALRTARPATAAKVGCAVLSAPRMMVASRCAAALVPLVLSLAASLLFAKMARPVTLLVEAESFSNPGGWVVDPQFMDQMGSPYLLAHGL